MAIDGIFIHYLVLEISNKCKNERINKIICINNTDYIFCLSHHYNLLVSLNANDAHIRLTNNVGISCSTNFSNFLKHHLEGSIIKKIEQFNNDRIITFTIEGNDALGYIKKYKMILELTGKFSNMIITNEDYIIMEALKKSYPSEDIDARIIQSKVKYEYLSTNKSNPFIDNIFNKNDNIYEGMSNLYYNELLFQYNEKNINVLDLYNKKLNPCIITNDKKCVFYCFDLEHQLGNREYFNDLSSLLEYYYVTIIKETLINNEQKRAIQIVTKEIQKLSFKLEKQEAELLIAKDNLKLEQIANILASNIHLVKPYQKSITVYDFYNDCNITIELNTNISPNENVNYYFNKYKKCKRTILVLNDTINNTKNDIKYYQCLQKQLENATTNDLKDILIEIGIKKNIVKRTVPTITKYTDLKGNMILVGKNNTQNDYITNTLAKNNDYFFHVTSYPGSHVIFQGNLDDDAIKLASTIAVYHSKLNGIVSVDYVQKKYVKKIKGMKGSFVTYSNQKTTHADNNFEYIKKNTH